MDEKKTVSNICLTTTYKQKKKVNTSQMNEKQNMNEMKHMDKKKR